MSQKLKIHFYPDVDKDNFDSGIMSEISWQRLHPFLEQAFAMRDGERLIGITVTEAGIKAKFDFTPTQWAGKPQPPK